MIQLYVGPYVIKVENNKEALTKIAEEMEEALDTVQEALEELEDEG